MGQIDNINHRLQIVYACKLCDIQAFMVRKLGSILIPYLAYCEDKILKCSEGHTFCTLNDYYKWLLKILQFLPGSLFLFLLQFQGNGSEWPDRDRVFNMDWNRYPLGTR